MHVDRNPPTVANLNPRT